MEGEVVWIVNEVFPKYGNKFWIVRYIDDMVIGCIFHIICIKFNINE